MGAIMSVDRKIVEVGRVFRLSGPALAARILLRAYHDAPEPADEHFGFSRLPR